ncbi:hypothetical protein JCM8547_008677 [Rhodosporidiobolus lusitaniae]
MTGVAGGRLAAEVHKAGGVGFIGSGHAGIEQLKSEAGNAREALGLKEGDELPLGVGLTLWRFESPYLTSAPHAIPSAGDRFLRYILFVVRARFLWLSFSAEGVEGLENWVKRVREMESVGPREEGEKERTERVKLWVMVQNEAMGKRARDWEIEAVVAQGTEAGGHGATHVAGQPLFTLLSSLVPHFPSSSPPYLLAAGGLSSPSSVSKAFSAGAAAAVSGTAFQAATESLLSLAQQALLVAAPGEAATMRTAVWDLARDGQNWWTEEVDGRALRNKTTEEGAEDPKKAHERYKVAVGEKDLDRVITWAGTGVGAVTAVRPAREIVADLASELDVL